ncbi:MAG: VOC family protein, partial [Acidimicrobiia bacterium]
MSLTGDRLAQAQVSNLRLGGIDHMEFWVGNARQAAGFLAAAFGFEIIAYAGPETGVEGRASYVLRQGDIRFVVTAGLSADSPVTAHARAHGDGVRDVAFVVDNAALAYERALARGATGLVAPWVESDADGRIIRATVATYGDTRHTFVERADYTGLFAPGYQASELRPPVGPAVGLV